MFDPALLVLTTVASVEEAERPSCFETLAAAIRELHSYEVPEILALEPYRVDERYLAWIRESTGEDGEGR